MDRRKHRNSACEPRLNLVAGGAGFLGSHLCDRLLERGEAVVCVDNLQSGRRENLRAAEAWPNFTFVEADITELLPAEAALPCFDRIYNLACAASPPIYQADPEHTMMTNVLGSRQLLRLAEKNGARFLLSSTSEVYGDPEEHPQKESYRGNVNCIGPRACYDEGKRAAEALAFDFDRLNRAEVRVARIFNTYGPRLSAGDGRVVSNLIVQALTGESLTIFGDGSQTRSFCYVDDLIDGLIRLMDYEGAQPGPINLGNPAELTVLDLARVVRDLADAAGGFVTRPLPVDDPRRRRPDISKAEEWLDWTPKTSLEDGLQMTIAWFEAEGLSAPAHRSAPAAALSFSGGS